MPRAHTLSPGEIVVMDNLPAHKGPRVEQLIKAAGAQLRYLPALQSRHEPDRKSLLQALPKAFLRKIAERTVAGLLRALETSPKCFKPSGKCANYFKILRLSGPLRMISSALGYRRLGMPAFSARSLALDQGKLGQGSKVESAVGRRCCWLQNPRRRLLPPSGVAPCRAVSCLSGRQAYAGNERRSVRSMACIDSEATRQSDAPCACLIAWRWRRPVLERAGPCSGFGGGQRPSYSQGLAAASLRILRCRRHSRLRPTDSASEPGPDRRRRLVIGGCARDRRWRRQRLGRSVGRRLESP